MNTTLWIAASFAFLAVPAVAAESPDGPPPPPPPAAQAQAQIQGQAQEGKPAAPAAPSASPSTPDLSPLVHETILDAPCAEVWKVWSTADGFKALGPAKVDMDFRVGGLIRSHYSPKGEIGDAGTIQNRILAYEPERMIAFRIDKPPAGFPFKEAWKGTWSVATLTDLGGGRTHLRLASMGYAADDESQAMRRFFQSGNDWSIKKLAAHFNPVRAGEVAARAHADDPLAPVEVSAEVPGACEDVWNALTASQGWKAFLGVDSSIELRPGGRFEIYFNPGAPEGQRGSEGCTVLGYDPRRMLSFTWNAPPKFERARKLSTWVVARLEPRSGKGTQVAIKHLGFAELAREHAESAAEIQEVRAYFAAAWPKVLAALSRHFEAPQAAPVK